MQDVYDLPGVVEGVRYTERTVTARDGVSLAVREYGSRAAEHTVVLLHGLCLDQTSWDVPLGLLLRRWGHQARVITYDHRGHGQSGRAPIGTYTVDQLAHDLADVLSTMTVAGPLTLAGHSMGGMTALAYLSLPGSQQPAKPVGLVLVATAAGKVAERGMGRLLATPAARLLGGLLQRVRPDTAERVIRTLAPPVCSALAAAGGFGDEERSTFLSMSAGALGHNSITTAVGFLSNLRDYDAYSALGAICAQTTVISGGVDVLTPSSHARDMAESIPGATQTHIADAGHMLLLEIPEVVSEAISEAIAMELIVGGDRDLADIDAAMVATFGAPEF